MKKKKTPPIKHYKIENGLYHYVIFLIVGGTKGEAVAWTEKKFEGTVETYSSAPLRGSACCLCLPDEPSHVIWFEEAPGVGILAHEALHSVCHIMGCIGMGRIDCANEEAYTYLLQWTCSAIGRKVW